jgi:hypothetical protein
VPAPVAVPTPATVAPTPASVPDSTDGAEPGSSKKWILVALAIVALAILGFAISRMGRSNGIEVINLAPGEKLYIGGLLVDPNAPRVEKPGALLVSTAVDGKLRRFGRTERRDRIDVRTIPEALPQPGSTGTLSLVGNPKGCTIKVGDSVLPENTPKMSIEAGKELPVIISCPGSGGLSVSVMAVPGQEVELDPQPKN